ncbi:eyes absent homolog 3 isoform X2 [Salmo salar]|uniref:Eyes absent homolog n=1 Tax=Salmo salar TaxID=8030 RepID=A0A1S3Q2M7_SALSA|nr:eyes absent homolog 3 isoform X2 [Salmo salar]XP_014034157.2 eyes absent homolog 3 isoform X2 [Salmo salar]XP_045565207.1 eyes absent homolog 3 isoform X2 [Salmo salar]XP_045565208.1 eyes absent homolog 3 isoform X2 [Salmo salar]XP_045565209.1 eyes absent homolog 3 isoform X2 [Salmo salar]
MDDSQDLPELPTKKARHELDVGLDQEPRGLRDDQIPPTLLGSGDQDNSYSTLSDAQLDGAVASRVLTTTTASEYNSHIYQGSRPAVTSYTTSQGAFPPLAQATVYTAFPQAGQTQATVYTACPQAGQTRATVYTACPQAGQTQTTVYTAFPQAGQTQATVYTACPQAGQTQTTVYTTFPQAGQTQATVYTAFPQAGQTYGLPPFGAMWPGIKSETGLPDAAPSVGQPGFLSFRSAYTSTQPDPDHVHCSYPSQGSSFTTSSVYTNIPCASAATEAHQEFSSNYNVNSLGQTQFPQYYAPPLSYVPAGLPNSEENGSSMGVAGYPAIKTEGSALAGLPSTTDACPRENLPPGVALPTGVALPMGALDQDEAGRRNPAGKAKGKAKKSDSNQPTDADLERIFLWDLDETIIIFHSLLTGSFSQKFGKDSDTVLNLGLQMEELIFELADTHLFFNDLEECDQVHVEDVASDDNGQDLSAYNFLADGFNGPSGGGATTGVQGGVEWMTKLAFRYRRLREIYNGYKGNVGGLLSPMKRELLLRLQSEMENMTDAWLSTALKSLLLIQSRSAQGKCMNVLVTTTQLVPALAKVLLYGLGDVFPIENIYSATKIGKESCFERIVSRFGKNVTYVVIGDGRDEEFAAKQHNMPFWRITTHGDLVSLHQALELDFL